MAPTTSPSNVLSSDYLSRLILASLPRPEASSSPQLTRGLDAIAIAAHAAMIAVGFRLVALGDARRLDTPSTAESPQSLPSDWAATTTHDFRYRHAQSSLEFLLKVSPMESSALIVGKPLASDTKSSYVEIDLDDWISKGNLPFATDLEHESDAMNQDGEGEGDADRETPTAAATAAAALEKSRKRLEGVYITAGRLSDLGSLMQVKIIQKLAPSLQKDGYEEAPATTTAESESTTAGAARADPSASASTRDRFREAERARVDPLRDYGPPRAVPRPYGDFPMGPRPGYVPSPDGIIPGFDDELQVGVGGRLREAQRRVERVGDRDLYPQGLGPNDPFHPYGPGPSFGPGRGGGGGGGGGSIMTLPDIDRQFRNPQAPPGARSDFPYGPGPGAHPRGAGVGGFHPGGPGGFGGPGGYGGFDFNDIV